MPRVGFEATIQVGKEMLCLRRRGQCDRREYYPG
jgi:hypothetical protein